MLRFLRALIKGLKSPEFTGLAVFVIVLISLGTWFYMRVEGWHLVDALYFSAVTLTTVGYGDFTPQTDLGKLFTIGYLFVGIGAIVAFVNAVARHATNENPILQILANQPKSKPSSKPARPR